MNVFSIIGRAILVFIGTCFFLPGMAPTVLIVLPAVQDEMQMSNWKETAATLEKVNLETKKRAGMETYQAHANYRYQVAGVEYKNDRVDIVNGTDNFDDVQKTLWKTLDTAFNNQQTVPVYYNPQDPTDSVLTRQLPWFMFKIILSISLVFGGGGLLLIYLGLRRRKVKPVEERQYL